MPLKKLLSILVLVLAAAAVAAAQTSRDPNNNILPRPEDPETQPKSVREMLTKLQIDQAKKEYDEMLERGDEALKLSSEIEQSFAKSGALTDNDRSKLQGLEKIVKKIRGELGGDDTDQTADPDSDESAPDTVGDVVKNLPSLAGKLVSELKKTTRFSISAAAIQSTNSVLRAVRFLRTGN